MVHRKIEIFFQHLGIKFWFKKLWKNLKDAHKNRLAIHIPASQSNIVRLSGTS